MPMRHGAGLPYIVLYLPYIFIQSIFQTDYLKVLISVNTYAHTQIDKLFGMFGLCGSSICMSLCVSACVYVFVFDSARVLRSLTSSKNTNVFCVCLLRDRIRIIACTHPNRNRSDP